MNPYTKLPDTPIVPDRHQFLVDFCRGKRVLHIGCVDTGLLDERFAQGRLLHQRLAPVTQSLWGIDIDGAGMEFLRAQGFDNLVIGDVSTMMLGSGSFDVILASEVVEHLLNPGLFLAGVRTLMTPGQTRLVVTVPNAFRVQTLRYLLQGVEYVHPDHNYWFSYVTIANLLRKSGYQIEQLWVYSHQRTNVLPRCLTGAAGASKPAVSSAEPTTRTASGMRFGPGLNVASYMRQLPLRMLTAWLYHQTAFWGDGLIVVAQRDVDADRMGQP